MARAARRAEHAPHDGRDGGRGDHEREPARAVHRAVSPYGQRGKYDELRRELQREAHADRSLTPGHGPKHITHAAAKLSDKSVVNRTCRTSSAAYTQVVELLEREAALSTLAAAREAAARGAGRVVFVSGEPGIGKTTLVNRFLRDLDETARVLVGTCDDLAVPRPLGPFRDLAGAVSAPLRDALAAGAAPHDIQALLLAELQLPPIPTVLVLEDVHWADDATLDSITVLGRRIATLPAVLVLTFRSGEAPPGHHLYRTVGAIRAEESDFIELGPLSAGAVASLAGEDAERVYAASGGNPFYVTELMTSRAAAALPPSVANAVVGRAARLDEDSRRLIELVSVVPNRIRTSLLDIVMPGWPGAAMEPERQHLLDIDTNHVRFRHELTRHAIVSSVPSAARRRLHAEILEALLEADADPADIVHHAEAAGATDVVAEHVLVAARRAAALASNREAFSHYLRAADFVDRMSQPEHAMLLEELAAAAYDGRPAAGGVHRRGACHRDRTAISTTPPRSAAAPASWRASTGTPATATQRSARRARRSRSSSRSATPSRWRAPTASCRSSRC